MRAVQKALPESLAPELIAPCGMNCGLCSGHLRERNRCPGCNGDDSAKPGYCVSCKIKTCSTITSGSISFCFDCDSYPCARLRQLDKRYRTKYGMSMLTLGMHEEFKKYGISVNGLWPKTVIATAAGASTHACGRSVFSRVHVLS